MLNPLGGHLSQRRTTKLCSTIMRDLRWNKPRSLSSLSMQYDGLQKRLVLKSTLICVCFHIQRIVTMSIYGQAALNICHL